jgi:hypothetical protein
MELELPLDVFNVLIPFLDSITTARYANILFELQSRIQVLTMARLRRLATSSKVFAELTWRCVRFWEFPTEQTCGRSFPWNMEEDSPHLFRQLQVAKRISIKISGSEVLRMPAFTTRTLDQLKSFIKCLSDTGRLFGVALTTPDTPQCLQYLDTLSHPQLLRALDIDTTHPWRGGVKVLQKFSGLESLGMSIAVESDCSVALLDCIAQGMFPNLCRLEIRFSEQVEPDSFFTAAEKALRNCNNRSSFFLQLEVTENLMDMVLEQVQECQSLDTFALQRFGLPRWSQLRIETRSVLVWSDRALNAALGGLHLQFHQLMSNFFLWDYDDKQKNYIWVTACSRLLNRFDWNDQIWRGSPIVSFIDWVLSRFQDKQEDHQTILSIFSSLLTVYSPAPGAELASISATSRYGLIETVKAIVKQDVETGDGYHFRQLPSVVQFCLVPLLFGDRDWVSTLRLQGSQFHLGLQLLQTSPDAPRLQMIIAWLDEDWIDPIIRSGPIESNMAEQILKNKFWLLFLIPAVLRAMLRRSENEAVTAVFSALKKELNSLMVARVCLQRQNTTFLDEMLRIPGFQLDATERQACLDQILRHLLKTNKSFYRIDFMLQLDVLLKQKWCQECVWPKSDAALQRLSGTSGTFNEEAVAIFKEETIKTDEVEPPRDSGGDLPQNVQKPTGKCSIM